MPYSPDWEKSFENKFGDLLSLGSEPFNDTYVQLHVKPAIKDYIRSLLQAREEWLRGEIERLIPEGTDEIVGAYWLKGRLLHLLTPKN